ncbi:MAG: envelope stress response membrane protein PspB [Sphingomonadales bacterium]|nr:envelope stress response membrane protein PspB [Sphingomonadales bacterium]
MDFGEFMGLVVVLIGLPWLILHYVTKWKTAPTLTVNDEALLEDLYQLARRLEDRMDTVERLVSADHPDYRQQRQLTDGTDTLAELDELKAMSRQKARRG